MTPKFKWTSPGMRLKLGASVIAAARVVDTKLVEGRLAAFADVHGRYVTAQRAVDEAEGKLRATQVRLAECDVIMDEAVETLACALITDGQPRAKPLEAFGAPAPGTLTRLPSPEAAQAVHQLVATIQRGKNVGATTANAAKAADAAARTVEEALVPMPELQDAVRAFRAPSQAGIRRRRPLAPKHPPRTENGQGGDVLGGSSHPPLQIR